MGWRFSEPLGVSVKPAENLTRGIRGSAPMVRLRLQPSRDMLKSIWFGKFLHQIRMCLKTKNKNLDTSKLATKPLR